MNRGVVLAGGTSERFGQRDKALAAVDGEPMIRRAVAAVRTATGTAPIVAVADDERARAYGEVLEDVSFVTDSQDWPGPLGGLAAAARESSEAWLFVCGCDMPLVDVETVAWLRTRVTQETDAVVPVVDGRHQTLHAWYRREAALAALEGTGVGRMQDLVTALDTVEVEPAVDGDAAALARSVTNVNTQAELDALEL